MSRKVEIIVTNQIVGYYEARSYPDEQRDANGFYRLYRVPIYNIVVRGTDDSGAAQSFTFTAPRFMPYYNDPQNPSPNYSTKGWVNSGLSSARTVRVSRYISDYAVRNRYSPGRGAIVVYGTFYIHAGPANLGDVGFGSAGCIEIIGNYDHFKQAIASLSGIQAASADDAIKHLVSSGKLTVIIEAAVVPDISKSVTRTVR